MKHAVTRELHAYWSRLRKMRAAPERQDIDPAAIRTLLSDTFILEVGGRPSDPDYTLRLSGTRLNALFLSELKGRSLLALWSPADRDAIADMLSAVVDDCSPVVAGLRAAPAGHRPIDLEMILLPLKHHGQTHARVLGALAPIEVPSWLGLLPIESLSLSSFRLLGLEPSRAVLPEADRIVPRLDAPRRYGRFLVHEGGR